MYTTNEQKVKERREKKTTPKMVKITINSSTRGLGWKFEPVTHQWRRKSGSPAQVHPC